MAAFGVGGFRFSGVTCLRLGIVRDLRALNPNFGKVALRKN